MAEKKPDLPYMPGCQMCNDGLMTRMKEQVDTGRSINSVAIEVAEEIADHYGEELYSMYAIRNRFGRLYNIEIENKHVNEANQNGSGEGPSENASQEESEESEVDPPDDDSEEEQDLRIEAAAKAARELEELRKKAAKERKEAEERRLEALAKAEYTRLEALEVFGIQTRDSGTRVSLHVINVIYKAMAKLYHPDINGGKTSDNFMKLQKAYEALKNNARAIWY